jgi:hypothetical protein
MRLARPVYEALPITYVAIGAAAILLASLEESGTRSGIAFMIGFLAWVAAFTLYLRRRDYRERSREYSGLALELSRAADPAPAGESYPPSGQTGP